MSALGLRWTIGDVSSRGWESLRLSVHCAFRLFGPGCRYVISVNGVAPAEARERAGSLPAAVEWRTQTAGDIPDMLRGHLDPEMAEGVGWKLVPPRIFTGQHELALDNDCILWSRPQALEQFLQRDDATLLAEDMERCLGQFDSFTPHGTMNSGIRGLPPQLDYPDAIERVLRMRAREAGGRVVLQSELDEQGLQAAALHQSSTCLLVSRREVSICSPFWPRDEELGSCGAHFVGLNPKHIPWDYYDQTADDVRRAHWDRHRPELYRRAGLEMPPALPLSQA